MKATIHSSAELERFIASSPAAAVYFSGPDCGVCVALEPKLENLFRADYPKITLAKVNVAEAADAAAQWGVFTVPTLLVFFEGREAVRRSRTFSLAALNTELQRPYALLFGGGG